MSTKSEKGLDEKIKSATDYAKQYVYGANESQAFLSASCLLNDDNLNSSYRIVTIDGYLVVITVEEDIESNYHKKIRIFSESGKIDLGIADQIAKKIDTGLVKECIIYTKEFKEE